MVISLAGDNSHWVVEDLECKVNDVDCASGIMNRTDRKRRLKSDDGFSLSLSLSLVCLCVCVCFSFNFFPVGPIITLAFNADKEKRRIDAFHS